MTIIFVI